MGSSPESHPWLSLEHSAQPPNELPPNANVFWFLMHPNKDENGCYPEDQYSEEERMFWGQSILAINGALEHEADDPNPDNPFVYRLVQPETAINIHKSLHQAIATLLTQNPTYLVIEPLQGAILNWITLYNNPHLSQRARDQIVPAIISGSSGPSIGETCIRTQLPQEAVKNARMILFDDDVGDTMAALAAAVEQVFVLRKEGYIYDSAFVKAFSHPDTPLTTSQRKELYAVLVQKMQEVHFVAAIPLYKNPEFLEELLLAVNGEDFDFTSWHVAQQALLQYRIDGLFGWLMGMALDTGVKLKDLLNDHEMFPDKLITHPAIASVLAHTMDSELRIGCTINGLIALQDRQYPRLHEWIKTKLLGQFEARIQAYEKARQQQN